MASCIITILKTTLNRLYLWSEKQNQLTRHVQNQLRTYNFIVTIQLIQLKRFKSVTDLYYKTYHVITAYTMLILLKYIAKKLLKTITILIYLLVTKALSYVLTMYISVVDRGTYVSLKTFTIQKLQLQVLLKVKVNVKVLSVSLQLKIKMALCSVCQLWISLNTCKTILKLCKAGSVKQRRLHTLKELKQVVTDTHYLNVLEIMNKQLINQIKKTKLIYQRL